MLLSLLGCSSGHTARRVDLSWDPSVSAVIGYNVYRGTQSGGPYTKLNSFLVTGTDFTDSSVQAGRTFFYVVKAVDSQNVQSAPSEEISAEIPSNAFFGSAEA